MNELQVVCALIVWLGVAFLGRELYPEKLNINGRQATYWQWTVYWPMLALGTVVFFMIMSVLLPLIVLSKALRR